MSKSDKQPVIFLMGSTASGKTDIACQLYDELPVELINVDSAQVYKGMDIGSAKLTPEELARYPHHLIDIREPHEPYSAAQFREDALLLIEQIHARGKIPLFVGGTMLYYKVLREGIADLPQADETIRAEITALAEREGWPAVHKQLAEVDAETAERLEPNDSQRLQRALEVYRTSGKPLSWHHKHQKAEPLDYPLLQIALTPSNRTLLHERIAQRFRLMVEQGLVEEVQRLRKDERLHLGLPSIKSAGYKQAWEFLDGLYDQETMIEKGVIATRQLAKRQLTWLRGWDNLNWFETENEEKYQKVLELIKGFVRQS